MAGWAAAAQAAMEIGSQAWSNHTAQSQNATAYARQVDFYKHRYQWQVEDMKAAGLNPGLSYNYSPGSAPTTPNAAPTSRQSSVGAALTAGQQVATQKEVADAQVRNLDANSAKQISETGDPQVYRQMQLESLQNKFADTDRLRSEAALNGVRLSESEAAALSHRARAFLDYAESRTTAAREALYREQGITEPFTRARLGAESRHYNASAAGVERENRINARVEDYEGSTRLEESNARFHGARQQSRISNDIRSALEDSGLERWLRSHPETAKFGAQILDSVVKGLGVAGGMRALRGSSTGPSGSSTGDGLRSPGSMKDWSSYPKKPYFDYSR